MIIINNKGLNVSELDKVVRPWPSPNTGTAIDFEHARAEASAFLRENPDLLDEVGKLLDELPE